MQGVLVKTVYSYTNVKLEEYNATVTATEVTIKDGKVTQITNGIVNIDNSSFNFSINPSYDSTQTLKYNLNNVPQDVDGQGILKAFVELVELDVA